MIDILRDYLGGAASPECVQMISDVHDAVDGFGIEDYAFRFEQILTTNEEVDAGQTVQQIYDTTRALQVEVLNALGVTPSDDARVDHLTVLMNGISAIETYQDPQSVIQQCSLERHPEEILAEVLTLTTHLPAEELLVDLHAVDPMTIARIKAVSQQRQSDEEPVDTAQLHAKHIKEYRRFRSITGGLDLIMDHFLAEGIDVGYPFALYANLVGFQFEAMPVTNIAATLVSMAILSSDGYNSPRTVIQPQLDHLINDLDLLTKVDITVGDMLPSGRLRKPASGKVPEFVYFSYADIEKHMTYHERKVDLLRSRALYFQTENVYTPVRPPPLMTDVPPTLPCMRGRLSADG